MLATKDGSHVVRSTVGGLAHAARVPVEACRKALEKLCSPDPDGLDQPYEGRRLQPVEHGWYVLNGESYRRRRDSEDWKAYQAEWARNKRAKLKLSSINGTSISRSTVDNIDLSEEIRLDKKEEKSSSNGPNGHVQAALPLGSVVTQSRTKKKTPLMTEADMEDLRSNPAYDGIDIDKESWKFKTYCDTNGRLPTKRFFVNWLNKIS